MASLQFSEEPIYRITSRTESTRDWLSNKKFKIAFISVVIVTFITFLSVYSYQQSQLYEKIAVTKSEILDFVKSVNGHVDELTEKMDFQVLSSSAQSCQELQSHGFNQSGFHFVDPDGRYYGKSAFLVYCNFELNETRIPTMTKPFEIFSSNQEDFEVTIRYNTSKENIERLIVNSVSCHQEVHFECHVMPLHMGEINHGFWMDKNGNERYFYDGFNATSRKCKCSNDDGECQKNKDVLCNCDLRPKFGMEDQGKINTDWLLPITKFGYRFHGHPLDTFTLQNGSAKVTIGDIVCQDSNNLKIQVDGSLRLLDQDKREKVFWHNWGQDFTIEFDLVGLKNKNTYSQHYDQESWTILEVITEDPIPRVFTKIVYVPSQANLTFIQATDNQGIVAKSYTQLYHNYKRHFKANAFQIRKDSSSPVFYKSSSIGRSSNHLVSRKTRFSIQKLDCSYFDVSNLVISNENGN